MRRKNVLSESKEKSAKFKFAAHKKCSRVCTTVSEMSRRCAKGRIRRKSGRFVKEKDELN